MPNDLTLKTIILEQKKEVAQSTRLFCFKRPEGFSFKAGQYINIILNVGQRRMSHSFSIASSPSAPVLEIAMRMTGSPYKNALDALSLGAKLEFMGPQGKFTLPDGNNDPIIMLAGGIGVSPLRSMIMDELEKQSQRAITLFYSNHIPESAAFMDEFSAIKNPHFKFVPTMTGMEDSREKWEGEKGYITPAMIKKYAGEGFSAYKYYIVGPSVFVKSMRDMLVSSRIPITQIIMDDFGASA